MGRVVRMRKMSCAYKISVEKLEGKRTLATLRRRCDVRIEMALKCNGM